MRNIQRLLMIGGLVFTANLAAIEAKSEKQAADAVKYRKAIFQLVKSNMGPLGAMAKGNIPFDTVVMGKNGERLGQLAAMLPDYFAIDTRPFLLDTEAKDVIWENTSDFNSRLEAFQKASAGVVSAASSGNESSYKKAIGALGKSCKGCHDNFKED